MERRPHRLLALAPVGVFVLAFAFLAADLDHPSTLIFDEVHYVRWGREIANNRLFTNLTEPGKPETVLRNLPVNAEHPPFGKQLVAWSLELNGAGQLDLTWDQYKLGCEKAANETAKDSDHRKDPPCAPGRTWAGCDGPPKAACEREAFAWRLPMAITGALGVAAAYVVALRLFRSPLAGIFASAFLLLDNLWYLESRTALLDVMASGLAVTAFALALGPRWPVRLASGIVFGLAVGTKLPALYLLPFFIVIHLLKVPGPLATPRLPAPIPMVARLLGAFVFSIVLPAVAYVATYWRYIERWNGIGGADHAIGQLTLAILYSVSVGHGFVFKHDFASTPEWWIPLTKPVFYYHPNFHYGLPGPPYIYAVGNVALWWPATLAILTAPIVILVTRVRQYAPQLLSWTWLAQWPSRFVTQPFRFTPARSVTVAALLFLTSYAPWFLLSRTAFNFYIGLNLPYFAIFMGGLAYLTFQRSLRGRGIALGYLALVAWWSLAWFPLVNGSHVSDCYWDAANTLVPWMGTAGDLADRLECGP